MGFGAASTRTSWRSSRHDERARDSARWPDSGDRARAASVRSRPQHLRRLPCVRARVRQREPARPRELLATDRQLQSERRPGLATFHLSLACNHCLDAPCLRYCPALAISRDPATGAVLIDDRSCIGCRYCSWSARTMRTLQRGARRDAEVHALRPSPARWAPPACASLCPTGALRIGEYEAVQTRTSRDSRGSASDRPSGSSRCRAARRSSPRTPKRLRPPRRPGRVRRHRSRRPPRKISLRSSGRSPRSPSRRSCSWRGRQRGRWAGAPRNRGHGQRWTRRHGTEHLHLGRKGRAWRAMLNWHRSWLSREVIHVSGVSRAVAGVSDPDARASGVVSPPCWRLRLPDVGGSRLRGTGPGGAFASGRRDGDFVGGVPRGVAAGVPWVAVPVGVARLLGFISRQSHRAVSRTAGRTRSLSAYRRWPGAAADLVALGGATILALDHRLRDRGGAWIAPTSMMRCT